MRGVTLPKKWGASSGQLSISGKAVEDGDLEDERAKVLKALLTSFLASEIVRRKDRFLSDQEGCMREGER
jgi:hypothetical protein